VTSFYFAAAFLAGFRERLAPVLASRAELALAGPDPAAVPNSSHSRAA
jgi:hypothetical protein